MTQISDNERPTLVLGGTGKTGRRVVQRLRARGLPVREGTSSGQPPFAETAKPRDFTDYATRTEATGIWTQAADR